MKKLSFVFIVLASIFWGTSGLFVSELTPYGFTSFQMTFIRSLVFLICMGIFILIKNKKLFKVTFKEILLYIISGVSFFFTASCYFYSMELTSVSTAVVLMYTAPIFVMIYSVSYLGERFTKFKLLSVILMISGCVLISGITQGFKVNFIGLLMGILSGIAYSTYNIITKIQMNKKCQPEAATFYTFLVATILGFIGANPYKIPSLIPPDDIFVIVMCIGLGIFTCVLPYLLYTLALKDISAGTASTLAVMEPMAATVFSVLILKEKLAMTAVAGILMILSAVILLSFSENKNM